jgi:hypothetical protein
MQKIYVLILFILTFGVNLNAQYPNILISTLNYPNEPSIMINPKNTAQMVAGTNIDNFYYSWDSGLTWQEGNLSSSYGVWGDPVIDVDTNGNFYFFHLSNPQFGNWIDRIVSQKSIDGGQTWNDGSYMGLNGTKAQDKHWSAIDRTNNIIYVTWTQFDNYGSASPLDSSIILFSKSTDEGMTWSPAKRISKVAGDCIDSDNTDEGAVPAVGPAGEIYVSWAGPAGLVFNRSLDQGATWMDTNVFISDIPGGWDYAIPGIMRANGLPVTCCDLSHGPYRGTIYVNWTDQRNGITDTDVWLIKSTDGGLTWGERKRVNDDPSGKQQFFTWMTIDQSTGYLYFVFYDRRNYTSYKTDVYMAVSRDGGETFNNFKVSESPFSPNSSVFFGDYTNISASHDIVRPIWTRLESGELSLYTALVDSIFVGMDRNPEKQIIFSLDQNYPNPGREDTWISFKIHRATKVKLEVVDVLGREVATLINNRILQPGKYVEHFDISRYNPVPGLYYFSLTSGEQNLRRKMIIQ